MAKTALKSQLPLALFSAVALLLAASPAAAAAVTPDLAGIPAGPARVAGPGDSGPVHYPSGPQPFKGNLMNGGSDYLECEVKTDDEGQPVVRFCEGGPRSASFSELDDERVVSWDGQPIDADVTLPPEGDGPWPLVFMIHGYAGNKLEWETGSVSSTGMNNIGLARRGYAVVTYSTRGFGASCGSGIGYLISEYDLFWDIPKGQAACPVGSWVHLADARYEARDAQYMAGLLVDDGIAKPEIGVVGESYGGGHSLILSRLKDRIMLPDGTTEQWKSPGGQEMRVAAVHAYWPWSDLANSLLPNGRTLDTAPDTPTTTSEPVGVKKDSWVDTLYLGGSATGIYADPGCPDQSPDEPCPDLTSWYNRINEGEPYEGDDMAAIANEVRTYHSAIGVAESSEIDGPPAPASIASGWTDDLFPPIEGLRFYRHAREAGGESFLTVADVGHQRAQNKADAKAAIDSRGFAWLDHYLKGEGSQPGTGVEAWTMTCPKDEPSGGPYSADNWENIAAGEVTHTSTDAQDVDAYGGRSSLAMDTDPNALKDEIMGFLEDILEDLGIEVRPAADACRTTTSWQGEGVATYRLPASDGYTLLGFPTIEADITTAGAEEVDGMLAARLWDEDPNYETQVLVSKGVYRLEGNQKGKIVFQLQGNGWHFEQGHTPKVELLGRDDADEGDGDTLGIGSFRRSNNLDFTVRINSVKITLPTVEPTVEEETTGTAGEEQAAEESQEAASAPESAEDLEIVLGSTSLSLKENETKSIRKKTLAKLLRKGFRGHAEQSSGIEKIKAAIVRKRGTGCYRVEKQTEKRSCTETATRGIRLSGSGPTLRFAYRPLASGSKARHSKSAKRTLRKMLKGKILRKGTYYLIFKVYPNEGKTRKFTFKLKAR